jgi:hypothetical protein
MNLLFLIDIDKPSIFFLKEGTVMKAKSIYVYIYEIEIPIFVDDYQFDIHPRKSSN